MLFYIYLSLLKAIAKSKGKLIAIVGRAITIEREMKQRSKEIIAKTKQRSNREKTIIAIAILHKNIIVLYFDSTNIFANSRLIFIVSQLGLLNYIGTSYRASK